MIVLRAIGRFFARIGRWIKDTAWVQPLLIVGGIFLIIFSIPYITKWVQSWFSSDDTTSYFEKHKVSLKGADSKKSDADELMNYMLNYVPLGQNDEKLVKKYGTKFFLTFVEEECSACENAYSGFEVLEDNWGKTEFVPTVEGEEFTLYSIFTDTLNDDDENLFKTYFFGKYYDQYFEEVSGTLTNSYYYTNEGGDDSSYATELAKVADYDTFAIPTIFLVDLNDVTCLQANQMGVVEFLADVPGKDGGTNSVDKARTLFDCWERKDIFSKDYKKN